MEKFRVFKNKKTGLFGVVMGEDRSVVPPCHNIKEDAVEEWYYFIKMFNTSKWLQHSVPNTRFTIEQIEEMKQEMLNDKGVLFLKYDF